MMRSLCAALTLCWLAPSPTVAQPLRRLSAAGQTAVIVDDVPLVHTAQVFGTAANPQDALKSALTQLDEVLKAAGSDLSRTAKLNLYAANDDVAHALLAALGAPDFKTTDTTISLVVTKLPVEKAQVAADAVAISPTVAAIQVERKKSATVMPQGSRIYISGQAERGDSLRDATQKTLSSLAATLKHCGRTPGDIVQLKCFMQPMSKAADVMEEIARFCDGKSPPAVSLVEWKSGGLPIEIEAVAWGGPATSDAKEPLEFLTPPGMTSSPVFSRVTLIHRGNTIYIGDLFGAADAPAADHVKQPFDRLDKLLTATGSDLKHLVKATYYVTEDDVSKAHNSLRPKYYDPARPPAASKAVVASTGRPGVRYVMDLIAVPRADGKRRPNVGDKQ